MANTDKDIIVTPNIGSSTDDPKIQFKGGNSSVATEVTLRVYPNSGGTLSFEGSAGQLFSITNDLTGSIFSVNDVSGIPSIDVNADGTLVLAPYNGSVGIGTASASSVHKLHVYGGNIDIGTTGYGLVFPDNTLQTTALRSGVATPASYTGGISAITVDTYGRITSVTGSAGYTTNTGTVTTVSVASANGFAGTVATSTTTPAITLTTTVTGVLKGNGTAISAAAAADLNSAYGSQTANYFLAAPNGTAGNPSFRAIVAADIPILNQNTTGSAASATTSTTQAVTDDSTNIATTAWVNKALYSQRGAAMATGGGTVTYSGGYVLWSTRFIIIGNSKGTSSPSGNLTYYDINCPTSGSIDVVGTTAVTATASGIPIGIWQALYYDLGAGSAAGASAFHIVAYNVGTANYTIPSSWVWICGINGDTVSKAKFVNGLTLLPGQSFDCNTYSSYLAPTSATATTATTANALNTANNYQVNSITAGGGLSIGTNPALVANSASSTSQLIVKKTNQSTFSTLAWDSTVFLGYNIHYSNGAWVHSAPSSDNNNSLLAFAGGVAWYASNNGSGSWNVASGVSLWNQSGQWAGAVNGTTIAGTSGTFSSSATATAFIPSGATIPTNGLYLPATNRISFATNSTERMTIDATGNVGINTSSPTLPLEVNGGIKIGTTNSVGILFNSGSAFRNNTSGGSLYLDVGTLYVRNGNGANTNAGLRISGGLSVGENYATTTPPAGGIISFGDVGIGTSAPTYRLDVQSTNGGALARFKDSDSTYLGLVIAGDTNGGLITNGAGIFKESIYFQDNLNAMRFFTNTTERIRIDSSGRVGVGTSTMTHRFEVWGGNIDVAQTGFGIVFPDNSFQTTAYTGSAGLVTTFSAGTTGLTPNTATSGAVTLGGTLGLSNGGTNANLTASNGGILYSTATAFAVLAGTATAGQMLRSGATGAPSWSTATFPSTAGTAGTILRSNGTNWVNSTVTYVDTGTSGGIPYYSSTSAISSSALLTANALMIGGGAGAAPSTITTGTGVVTALGVNTGTAGAFVVNGGALGTPSSGTLTNCTFPTLNQSTTGGAAWLRQTDGTTIQNPIQSITTSGARGTDLAPNTYSYGIFSEFKNSSLYSSTGNYSGLITYANWVGTTASTGDPTYQLLFSPSAANSTANPVLKFRAGIDTTWGAWNTFLFSGGALGTPSSGTLTNCTGLTAAGGGTGQSTYTVGDILYASASNALSKLAAGTAGYALISGGASTAPSWQELTLTNIPDAWVKKSVRAATTAAITLSGTQTIDGVAVVANDRVLVKDQASAATNGIYVVAAGAWTRATDANTASKIAGAVVNVDTGTANGGKRFDTDFKSTDTLDTTSMTWSVVIDSGNISSYLTGGGATLTDDLTTNVAQYLTMSRTTSGSYSNAYIATSELYFNPSTGTLSSTVFNSLSDISVKENITTIDNATSTVNNLRGVGFNWKRNGKKSYGVIAQEIEQILPELVDQNPDDGTKSVNYSALIGFLIEAVKDLNNTVSELTTKINKLEGDK